jgi:mannose-1-phosphate guanylyltransferase/mannose-6-phosphate isomerase
MVVVTADHVIRKVDVFNQSLRLASRLADQGRLVTLGIKPTGPETGYGYIRYAGQVSEGFDHRAYHAERFVEKPDLETAKKYVQDGRYVWNSGMFIWQVETILRELRLHLPELMHKIDIMVATMRTPLERATFDELWPTLQVISIDYGVLEKTKNLVVIPVDIDWNDVGNWDQYASLFDADANGVRAVGPHQGLGCHDIFVYNDTARQVFTIGLEDVIIVEVGDKTLVCHRDAVQRVKELAESQLK